MFAMSMSTRDTHTTFLKKVLSVIYLTFWLVRIFVKLPLPLKSNLSLIIQHFDYIYHPPP